MNIKTEFTELECEYFRKNCNFTPQERAIFDLRVKDESVVKIADTLHMGTRTVERRILNIKKKILRVL